MGISIRIDPETETALRRRLSAEGVSLSDFVREAIREKLEKDEHGQATPFTVGEPLFGRYASGEQDRSVRRKALIRERVHAKRRR
jgi:Arc/MetJ-type ribon-helix-helix transcriptional regulator